MSAISRFIILVSLLAASWAWLQDRKMTTCQWQVQSQFTGKCSSLRIAWVFVRQCEVVRQYVAARLLAHKNTASLLAVSLPGCHRAACDRPAQRRSIQKSGRRDSNPRQPAWKAGGHIIAARLVYIGLTAGFIRYTCNVSGPGKRCRARFLRHSAKAVTCFCP
jgi:hypothetical protein